MEMYNCETKRLEKFWINVQDFWLKLYGSKKIYIAAINVILFINLIKENTLKYKIKYFLRAMR